MRSGMTRLGVHLGRTRALYRPSGGSYIHAL